ncbi:MAG: right-handed parallel beta-helix repeat-containing protein, partial [Clostridia bacterium]|nr:right-handed parallel beta-helix repeat-containing protein [Clostridia bacterium]
GGSISGNTSADAYSAVGGGVCIKNGSFIMEDGAISDNVTNDRGGGVYVENDNPSTGAGAETIFIMKGGSISGNASAADYSGAGGGVYVTNASFTMEKGTISDNVTQINGGGVYVENGSFTMEDGSISGNKTTSSGSSYGGGVYVYENSTFTMNGGTLSSNEASNGGGVYVVSNGSKIEITDSEISGNKSFCGGGIYITSGAEAEIHGGSIRDNIADGSNGGGIYVYSGTLNIDGTEISGCSASTCGGIYVSDSTANISNVTITGCSNLITDYGSAIYAYGNVTVTLTNGEITGNKKGAATYFVGKEFIISGAPHICDNEDGDLVPSGPTYKIENLEEGAKIGITGTPPTPNGVFTTGGAITEDNIKCFYSNDQKCIKVINGEASVSSEPHAYAEPVWSWAEDCTSADATFTCGNCQHAETVTASGEDIVSDVITPATCTSTGETAYTATVEFNGGTKTDTRNKEVAALPHDYADSTKYNSDGAQHWKICKNCTAEDTDHKENCSGGTATCNVKAVCSVCGNAYGDLDATNHAWGEWTVSKAATCTEKGEQARICSRDDTHKETGEIDAKGHSFGEWTVTKAATETEEGEERRICSNDNTHVETRSIPKVVPDNGGLSAGVIAGISVAGILLLLLIIYVVCYFALYRRDILLKGKFFDVIYAPMNAIFGKKEQEEETENS